MPIQTTYTNARAQFAGLWDEVTNNKEVVIIKRRGAEDVALIFSFRIGRASGNESFVKVDRKMQNVLLAAYERAMSKKGKPQSLEALKKEVGIE